jgi:acyl-CoA synthetase (AMP-forming)/AMP-acid ligase II
VSALVDRFAGLHRRDPDRPLIHVPAQGRTLSAADIDARRERYQDVLAGLPIRAGDLVISAAGNRAGAVPLLLACWAIDAPVLPVDVGTPLADLLDVADRFRASAIVTSDHAPIAGAVRLDDELSVAARAATPIASYRTARLLKLTSGSSGRPKAVLVTDVQLLSDTDHITTAMGITPGDVQIAAIPLSHAYGFGNLVMPLLLQGTAMVLRESFIPQHVTADARTYAARVFHGVPFMFQHYLAHPPGDGWPPTLTQLISAGAPLEPETVRGFQRQFGVTVHSFYGATEAGGIAFDTDGAGEVGTVGHAMPGVTIELRPDAGVPAGYGRVHVRSAAVSPCYVGDAADERDLADGGFLTGDYGQWLDDGRLVLAGRVSSFINVAGYKVKPAEVERVLLTIPGVTDARVIAVTDDVRGEGIAAVVEGPPGLALAAVRQHCTARLATYKIPRVVVSVEHLPRTPRGKADYRAIRALVDSRRGQAT